MRKAACLVLVLAVVQSSVPFVHSQTSPTITRAIGDWNGLLSEVEVLFPNGIRENLQSSSSVNPDGTGALVQHYLTSDGISVNFSVTTSIKTVIMDISDAQNHLNVQWDVLGAAGGKSHARVRVLFNEAQYQLNILAPGPANTFALVEPENQHQALVENISTSLFGQQSLLRLWEFIGTLPPTPATMFMSAFFVDFTDFFIQPLSVCGGQDTQADCYSCCSDNLKEGYRGCIIIGIPLWLAPPDDLPDLPDGMMVDTDLGSIGGGAGEQPFPLIFFSPCANYVDRKYEKCTGNCDSEFAPVA